MPKTNNFGLNYFGAEGRISDEGYKFSDKDRRTLDALLWTLFNHDHQSEASAALEGPGANNPPTLTLGTTSGTLPAGRDFHYKFSYLDASGNETAASITGSISTPDPILPPAAPALATASAGGTLAAGTYKYALAFYQASGETTAPNIATIVVPVGTVTNTVTITLPAIADGAVGWRIYRKSPADNEYYLLDDQAAPATDYVDDGSVNPDCTKRRKTINNTNSTNRVTVAIPASELPLDARVTSWRIYRTQTAGSYGAQSLVATVTSTTTEGGTDLVTSYIDTGAQLGNGIPLGQTSVPPAIPKLDASRIFDLTGGRIPASLAPIGSGTHSSFLAGTLAAGLYNQFYVEADMLVRRVCAFFRVGPTGVDGANNVVIRVKDDSLVDEVQHIWNNATTQNEIQYISNTATSGTFTLSDGVDTTSAIAFNASAATVETRLETDIASITDVTVAGNGTSASPWIVTFVNPGGTDVVQLIADDALMVGGTSSVYTSVNGSNGGTFTLSDGVDTTAAIAYNAAAATIETRLQTDITSITDVTVTGAGTEADPWVVTFVNPGDTNVSMLVADDTLLNGTSTIVEAVRGRGNTVFDLTADVAQQYFEWAAPATDFGEEEAEDATGGLPVSDALAGNNVAAELDAQFEENTWSAGTLEAGTYTFRFFVSDYDGTASFDIRVVDTVGPTTLATASYTPARIAYTPAYELEVTVDGTETIQFEVEKTDAGAGRVRVDRYEYEVQLPTLYAGQTATVEVLVNGAPTTNGDDVNLTIWH